MAPRVSVVPRSRFVAPSLFLPPNDATLSQAGSATATLTLNRTRSLASMLVVIPSCALPLSLALASLMPTPAPAQSSCAKSDSATAVVIRERLLAWVEAANRGDRATTREVWAPGLVGWFPSAAMFGDSAAYAAAGLRYDRSAVGGTVTYEIVIEEVAASGPVAAVHDVWTETRRLPGAAVPVRRVIRGSELWRCQPDGQWRIARYVSAPEPWAPVR